MSTHITLTDAYQPVRSAHYAAATHDPTTLFFRVADVESPITLSGGVENIWLPDCEVRSEGGGVVLSPLVANVEQGGPAPRPEPPTPHPLGQRREEVERIRRQRGLDERGFKIKRAAR